MTASPTRIGGYQVLGRLARGSTADIFLAVPDLTDDDTPAAVVLGLVNAGRRVVLKKLYPHLAVDEDFTRMFVDEVQLMSRFQHPHILAVHDLDDDDDSFFAVLELVNGPSASAALRLEARRQGMEACGLDVGAAVAIATATADAIVAVHGLTDSAGEPLGLVHRDVTPHNVLVGRDGAVKLADFGVAHSALARRSGALVTRETTAGTRKGKASYLAPEQILGHHPHDASRPVDQQADVHALGATLWCLLTGRPPFVAASDVALFDTILNDPPPRLADHGLREPALDALLQTLLAKVPEDRPPNAAAVKDALQVWQARSGGEGDIRAAIEALGLPSLA